jgi:hypothetical protein
VVRPETDDDGLPRCTGNRTPRARLVDPAGMRDERLVVGYFEVFGA